MNRKQKARIAAIGLGLWIILLAMLIITATTKTPRTTDAKTYDQACLTKPIANPLKDCEVKK